ncbi:carboxylase [Bordetella genomosp. 6]|uniref:carboxylase n=1 Tax=Bordetella genomosp. 6 TaxID=463024 RepID=UPI000A292CB0|nr:carboxylase [Bordetella genomosp. 6]ARP77608.1 carboxylase [Bordetella genomosp. 6]
MSRRIGIIDTTLRDAQQCLWATRMTAGMMDPIAQALDEAGFDMIDFMAPVQFDVCVRYLREDPFEKARHFRKRFRNTPMRSYCRSKSLVGFSMVPDDMVELWIDCLAANGFSAVGTLDSLLDVDNMKVSVQRAKKIGIKSIGALVFCESPLHTDALYAGTAAELVRCGVDGIMLKDSGALLTIERIRTLVPALRAAVGDIPIEVHSHSNTGLVQRVYLDAADLGIDQLHTSIAPLAGGVAQPSIQNMTRNLAQRGYHTDVDMARVEEISAYLHRLAARYDFPLGKPMEYDEFHYRHQMPGGMTENWRFQLRQAGLEHRFDEILEEIGRVREDLAWPIMVTPFSQIIGVQAMLNVVNGERYRAVPDEVKMYALGHFGRLLGPVEPNALDRIVANGSPDVGLTPQPKEPALPGLRKAHPGMTDEELLLRYMFPADDVEATFGCKPLKLTVPAGGPIVRLIEEILPRAGIRHFELRSQSEHISFTRP